MLNIKTKWFKMDNIRCYYAYGVGKNVLSYELRNIKKNLNFGSDYFVFVT